jgi:uncharacterized protein
MVDYHPRVLTARLREALADTPVVMVNGARQTGKTTLVARIASELDGRYRTLDDPTMLDAALADPVSFIEDGARLTIIDEVQKAPALLPVIKRAVDRRRGPGRFLLTGSADVLTLPGVSESLTGRIEVLTLHPLSQAEVGEIESRWIDRLFRDRPIASPPKRAGPGVAQRMVCGGFPEVLTRRRDERRRAWFDAYVMTIMQRDIRDLSNIEGLTALPRLLELLAVRSGALLNVAELGRAAGIPQVTLHRYLSLLQATFLFQPLSAWHANLGKRLIKAPKAYLLDSGLACALVGLDATSAASSPQYGPLLETFVLGELRRLAAGMTSGPRIYHYRSAGGVEVDFVLEDAARRIAGIDVKAAKTVGVRDFSGLRDLAESRGEKFACGVVLYGGEETVKFGPRLYAVPISTLWSSAE